MEWLPLWVAAFEGLWHLVSLCRSECVVCRLTLGGVLSLSLPPAPCELTLPLAEVPAAGHVIVARGIPDAATALVAQLLVGRLCQRLLCPRHFGPHQAMGAPLLTGPTCAGAQVWQDAAPAPPPHCALLCRRGCCFLLNRDVLVPSTPACYIAPPVCPSSLIGEDSVRVVPRLQSHTPATVSAEALGHISPFSGVLQRSMSTVLSFLSSFAPEDTLVDFREGER